MRVALIIAICVVLFMLVSTHSQSEYFRAMPETIEHSRDKQTDLMDLYVETDGQTRSSYHDMPVRMRSSEFVALVGQLHRIVVDRIIGYGKQCGGLNGADGLDPHQLTLNCNNDVARMEQEIIHDMTMSVIKHISQKYQININPYQIIGDMAMHLNLSEDVLYPLMYSSLYTVHGIQYVTIEKIKDTVNHNLDVKDILYTTLGKRGIVIIPDHDDADANRNMMGTLPTPI